MGYDVETGFYYVTSRYYSPELGRLLQPEDVSGLKPSSINGLNLYSYANNNPIRFSYNNSSAVGSTSVAGGLVSSIDLSNSFTGNMNSGSPSKGELNLGWLANGLDTGSTIHGLYTSISGLVNHTAYFAKNLTPFADDMTMLGTSMKYGVLAFNQFSWGLGKSDIFGIALGVGLDIYDSIQRVVSPGGVVLGATLTAAKGVGLIYLNKGIMHGATAIGSCFGPVGTVVGFVVGGVVCIVVDIFASNWLDDLIDKIAK
ncbi:MAG: RHS repeat-associated core domain-containing protein [Anaeroplasma sp.]